MVNAQTVQTWIDGAQTLVLGVVAWALISVMQLLRNEMKATAGALNGVLTAQTETTAALERLCRRIKAVENDQRPDGGL